MYFRKNLIFVKTHYERFWRVAIDIQQLISYGNKILNTILKKERMM